MITDDMEEDNYDSGDADDDDDTDTCKQDDIYPKWDGSLSDITFYPHSHHSIACRECYKSRDKQKDEIFFDEHLQDTSYGGSIHFADSDLFASLFARQSYLRKDAENRDNDAYDRNDPQQGHQRTFGTQIFIILLFLVIKSQERRGKIFFFHFPDRIFACFPVPFRKLKKNTGTRP